MALPLLEHMEEIAPRIEHAPYLACFFDYDGTLAPLIGRPAAARLDAEGRQLLQTLADRPGTSVAVLAGRSLEDLRRLVGLDEIIYVGNHGLEIRGPDFLYQHRLSLETQTEMVDLMQGLDERLASVPGAWIEDKYLSLTVHLRGVAPERRAEAEGRVREAIASLAPNFLGTAGEDALEVRPPALWNKGAACHWVQKKLGRRRIQAIYVGDDETDEEAFSILDEAITVRVGGDPTATLARYHVAGPTQVRTFLHWLAGRPAHTSEALSTQAGVAT
ncbi:MAG: trehalose-phosphatase [Gemmataceae bacterium]